MTREPGTEGGSTADPLGDDARALFAAGAREAAPARLRQALLARARGDLRSGVVARVAAAAPARWRGRSLWLPALSAAAALVAVLAVWGLRPWAPSEAPRISAERVPSALGTPLAPPRTTPERPASVPEAVAPRPRVRAERDGSRRAAKATPPPSVPSPALAPAPDALPQRVAPEPAAAPAPPDLGAQLKLLQSVQRALRLGEHRRALELLDASGSALEHGDLAAEARLMRIEALAGAGQPAEASRLAREFLRLYPHSPLVDRARRFSQPEALRP